jgi:anti-sigma B factor antagonist
VRPVFGRHLATHSASRGRFFSGGEFTIRADRHGDRQLVAPRGQLDLASAWQLERELRRAEATDAREIVVDLGGLELIDSTGMQVVIHALARARLHTKRVSILRGPDAVHRAFELSGLAALLPFVERAPGVPLP